MDPIKKIDHVINGNQLYALLNPPAMPFLFSVAGISCIVKKDGANESLWIKRVDWIEPSAESLNSTSDETAIKIQLTELINQFDETLYQSSMEFEAVFFSRDITNNLLLTEAPGIYSNLHISRALLGIETKPTTGLGLYPRLGDIQMFRTLKLRPDPDPIPNYSIIRDFDNSGNEVIKEQIDLVEKDALNYEIGTPCPPIWKPKAGTSAAANSPSVGAITLQLYHDKQLLAENPFYEIPIRNQVRILFIRIIDKIKQKFSRTQKRSKM